MQPDNMFMMGIPIHKPSFYFYKKKSLSIFYQEKNNSGKTIQLKITKINPP
ncbi:hypothetical protein HMPREF1608_03911 [Escherichia coli 908525]|nr:hypothetical protein HMPREF9553_02678 [Escherichia coli MS 200-1]EGB81542.1 hypothetical protein HMPREF9533_03673 [Escherichia coli MS 60-1]ESD04798.1 hypothetical protein HMPREF1595_04179 [Escherichia coli 907672]ESD66738.1 hypothetical protein HMPREF1608_03911 [Escherichia coli 908525]ESE22534.1 hypothetical protein HMPREF1623_02749 [Escherichia coli 910096-2]ESE34016.1 hypothetical protein HMPREF1622_02779 [Escherichia coli A35218R]KXG93679.1 hypothetical protein HMPREF3041_03197 [Esche